MDTKTKLEGFEGEIRIVVPPIIIKDNSHSKFFDLFYLTDIGYYPKAKNHFCKRPSGCAEHILIHCVAGKGVLLIDEEVINLEANQYVVIPANTSHLYHADALNPWTIYWMHFSGSQSNLIVDELMKRVLSSQNVVSFNGVLSENFNRFCKLLLKGYSREILDYISLNLSHFFSGYLYPNLFEGKEKNDEDVIEKSINYLKSQLHNKIVLADIANYVNLSISHFSKLFKNRTGYTPIEYLNHLKIQRACYLLQFTDRRISDISFELGVEDQYYFSRLFKDHMGISPSLYRSSLSES
ncbi:AraC family transcriptional regulator [Sphingobacterium endophyticum]|uniref:AraC family transcriptional regulator n=1 Tax=Sphingobacterium endophyticum TaxID=2546448 RepID=UPI0012E0E508|nr:AraC family transcriptional regulator [Sphingobacterium endophyticum]